MSLIIKKLLQSAPRQQKMMTQFFIRHQQFADQIHPGYAKLRKKQARFQVDDGCPVWLKRGWSDRLLYRTTVLLCFIGLGMTFKSLYDMVYPTQMAIDNGEEED